VGDISVAETRRAIDGKGATVMFFLCVVLGAQQVAIKLAAPDMAPIMQIALRSGISSLLIMIFLALRSEKLGLTADLLLPGLLLGTTFSLEFLFVAEGLRLTSASHMSVFLYTAPIFTALVLHRLVPMERLSRVQWGGICLAFCGIVATFAGGVLRSGFGGDTLRGDILALFAGASWASTTIIIRVSKLAQARATTTLLIQLVSAFLFLLVYAFGLGHAGRCSFSSLSVASLLFQAVIITFATYLMWFSMLRRYHVAQLSAFLFLSPFFGITFGVLILHDTLDAGFIAGALLVLAGVVCVSSPATLTRLAGRLSKA